MMSEQIVEIRWKEGLLDESRAFAVLNLLCVERQFGYHLHFGCGNCKVRDVWLA